MKPKASASLARSFGAVPRCRSTSNSTERRAKTSSGERRRNDSQRAVRRCQAPSAAAGPITMRWSRMPVSGSAAPRTFSTSWFRPGMSLAPSKNRASKAPSSALSAEAPAPKSPSGAPLSDTAIAPVRSSPMLSTAVDVERPDHSKSRRNRTSAASTPWALKSPGSISAFHPSRDSVPWEASAHSQRPRSSTTPAPTGTCCSSATSAGTAQGTSTTSTRSSVLMEPPPRGRPSSVPWRRGMRRARAWPSTSPPSAR
jgi:hypothetical protein